MNKVGEWIEREKKQFLLMEDFKAERPVNLERVDELAETLSDAERAGASSSLVLLKVRSMIQRDAPFEAAQALLGALRKSPLDLSLQAELSSVLEAVRQKARFIFYANPADPLNEVYYQLLLQENYASPEDHLHYTLFLIEVGRNFDAVKILRGLINLFPALVGLREVAERLDAQVPDGLVHEYVSEEPYRLSEPVTKGTYGAREIMALKETARRLYESLDRPSDDSNLADELKKIVPDPANGQPVDVALKGLYCFHASYGMMDGQYVNAIMILQTLVQVDPANMRLRDLRQFAIDFFVRKSVAKQKSGEALGFDPREMWTLVRHFGSLGPEFVRMCATKEAEDRKFEEARWFVWNLCQLNPFDSESLICAFEIAKAAGNKDWLETVTERIQEAIKIRPYDLTLVGFVQENLKD